MGSSSRRLQKDFFSSLNKIRAEKEEDEAKSNKRGLNDYFNTESYISQHKKFIDKNNMLVDKANK